MTKHQMVTLAGSVAMLAATLLLPLVNLQSYRFGFFELPHKIQRLVSGDVSQAIGYVLLFGLLLAPVVLALVAWLKGRASKVLTLLPLLFAVVLTVLLLVANKPSPGLGLWLYLAVAAVVAFYKPK